MDKKHAQLIAEMTEYDKGDARRVQHFMKVHDYAVTIATLEGMDESILSVLETTAILHDIGIHVSERKYGSSAGHYQELEGPAEARKLLDRLGGYTEAETDRVCWLIAHHHTYRDINALDYQILVEADFLVNAYEDSMSVEAIKTFRNKIFRTPSGISLLNDMFGLDPDVSRQASPE